MRQQGGKGGADVRSLLAYADSCLRVGAEGEAREVLLTGCRHPANNPATLRGWAKLAQELGLARQARECYQWALRQAPKDAETHYRLALLLADVGDHEESVQQLKKAIRLQPTHSGVRSLLAENYHQLGLDGQARVLAPAPEKAAAGGPQRYFPPSIGKADQDAFLRLFSGREVGCCLQQVDPNTAEPTLAYQNAPLDGELAAAHLLGQITLAAYPLRSDNTARYGALLLRPASGLVRANLKNKGFLLRLEEKLRHHLRLLTRYCAGLGLCVYPEQNGRHEFRLWLFFTEFKHFLKIKQLVCNLLDGAPQPESELVLEPLLATRPVGIGWMEQAVLLPLGLDRTTLQRSLFLDEHAEPVAEQLKWLCRIRPMSLQSTMDLLRRVRAGLPSAAPAAPHLPPPLKALLGACPVLTELARKARQGHVLRREEKVIAFYSVGLLDDDRHCLHSMLQNCQDYDYSRVQRQAERLKPNPISCGRIRELVPELTASLNCQCNFDLRGGKYPSPLLHVNPHLVPAAMELTVPAGEPMREVARRYVNLRGHLMELETALRRLEAKLAAHLDRTGANSLKAGDKTVHRVMAGGEVQWRIT